MAIGTTYRLSLVATISGTLHVNTFHFRQRIDTPGETPNTVLINQWKSIMEDVYRGLFPALWNFQEYGVFVSTGSPENLAVAASFGGRRFTGGAGLPLQNAAVITWLTGIAGRRFRGRSYIGGLGIQDISNQELTPLYLSSLDIFAYRLVNQMRNDSAFDPVVYSKVNGTTSLITGYTLRSGVYTQRRRTHAYGE